MGMEERRNALKVLALSLGVANLLIERLPTRFPPGRNAFEGADPVGNAKDIDTDGHFLRTEGQRRKGHITAVAAANDADLAGIDCTRGNEIFFSPDTIVEIGFAMLKVGCLEEALAVTAAAA